MKIAHLILCTPLTLVSGYALAEESSDRILEDPPEMSVARNHQALLAVPSPTTATTTVPQMQSSNEALFTWEVKKTINRLWNPATNSYDKVMLRSYQGTNTQPNTPYIAPTIEVFPGETVRATLDNQLDIDPITHKKLPKDPSCTGDHFDVNKPHCFDGTNMHTHGLWINPAGNSDNVLVSINPGVNFQYEYNIPPDHPAGTFWYHPHRHGSTAIQVASGMAGALIIRGYRQPTPNKTGDLDLLTYGFKERTLVFQQIQYACYDANGKIQTDSKGNYICQNNQIGEIRDYQGFGVGGWGKSGRYTSINGEVQPFITQAVAGQVERWRMIHAGVRDSINLSVRQMQNIPSKLDLTPTGEKQLLRESCTGPIVSQHLIAADGLTLKQVMDKTVTVFQPGYRFDALMQFPQEGRYCLIDEAASASANVDRTSSERRLLGIIQVNKSTSAPQSLTTVLSNNATRNIAPDMRPAVLQDLQQNLKLSHFVPHQDLPATPNKQFLEFNIDTNANPTQFQIDGKPYKPDRIDRTLELGKTDEWILTSKLASHPFHIHVNPFQIVDIKDPSGKDVSDINAVDDYDKSAPPDPQYRGLKGTWKDTIWVKNVKGASYKVIVRTKYQRYIGDFVLHCHILDHEDQGMMQNIRISLPDGNGGVSQGHH
ncbi:multicopper oxidase family protein [Acinetobacter seifertii]|uniref:multicopper oxidase family protein n=1 Tax=Acinetobacter seifertii TaxID=1530123 RepID=UPI000D396D94|nr:multicopper oxidase family protein [Acinetobacter seifertii]PTV51210.1 L-ascorbate oxidase [Acinetobacter seifertii]